MKELMKEAHKMTKEIKKEFPEVDYKAQLGICMSYLLNKEEKGMEEKITWEDVKKQMDKAVEELGVQDWKCNNWKKGDKDRTYLEVFYLKGKHYKTIKCGFWDNITEEYNSYDSYSKIYDIFKEEYV